MLWRSSIHAVALAAALMMMIREAQAFDDATFPDWKGQWSGMGGGNYDPSKPRGLGQQVPLKPEYQKILEASLADIAAGGQGNDPGYRCGSHGMPRVMIANVPLHFVILPETTYVLLERLNHVSRIHTDARAWPAQLRPFPLGYSIGKWLAPDAFGRYYQLQA